jgi:hypothetical protein
MHDPTVEALYAAGHWLLSGGRHVDAAKVLHVMVLAQAKTPGPPRDERGWLALGACHEGLGQPDVALELYRIGMLVEAPAVRCALARARLLHARGGHDVEQAFELAYELASEAGDDELASLALGSHR